MSRVSSIEKLPKDNYHIYHATSPRNEHDILVSGIKSSPAVDQWSRVNQFLERVRDVESISIGPSKRSQCVFCFPRYSDIVNSDDNMVFAINTQTVNQPMYRASYHTVTKIYEIVSFKSSMSIDDMIESRVLDADSKAAYELSVEYWNNMVETSSPIEKGGEVLIDGLVDKESITHYS